MDAAERLLEVVAGEVGEGVELFVAARQVGVDRGQVLAVRHHQIQHERPQAQGGLDLERLPGSGSAADRLLPQLEAAAGRQARAVRAHLGGQVVGVAGPGNSLKRLRAEPEQEILAQARHRDGEQAAGDVGEGGSGGVDLRQSVCGEGRPQLGGVDLGALAEPVGQGVEGGLRRDGARGRPGAPGEDRDAACVEAVQQRRFSIHQRVEVA